MHRWIWDLRYAAPVATRYEYPISAVPHDTPREPQGVLALPGTYMVRLNAGGQTLSAPLTVKIDPRVTATAADLASLFKVEDQLSSIVTDSSKAALEAHSAREQIEKNKQSATGEIKDSLDKKEKQFEELLSGSRGTGGREVQPGLDAVAGEASTLYGEVGQADAAPTPAQQQASSRVSEESREVLRKWETLKAAIPDLNRKLTAAHLPAIDLEQIPSDMPESGDED
jgi:hypothetical protein